MAGPIWRGAQELLRGGAETSYPRTSFSFSSHIRHLSRWFPGSLVEAKIKVKLYVVRLVTSIGTHSVWYDNNLVFTGCRLSGTRSCPFYHVPETVLHVNPVRVWTGEVSFNCTEERLCSVQAQTPMLALLYSHVKSPCLRLVLCVK
jgi:hypothetical protein